MRPSSAVNVKRIGEGSYISNPNSSTLLERKPSANSVIGSNLGSNRNSSELNKAKPLIGKYTGNVLSNSSNLSSNNASSGRFRPLQNSLNSAEMSELTKSLVSNKDGYNTTRPITSSDRKLIKTANSPNAISNNYLGGSSGTSRQTVLI